MDTEKVFQRIAAIVPAYNEAERIGAVLEVLTTYKKFSEVIVVDDGSTDNTEAIAKRYPVKFIKNKTNHGKARSMDVGVSQTQAEYIFFCDADISGLTHTTIDTIVNPVLEKKSRNVHWHA